MTFNFNCRLASPSIIAVRTISSLATTALHYTAVQTGDTGDSRSNKDVNVGKRQSLLIAQCSGKGEKQVATSNHHLL